MIVIEGYDGLGEVYMRNIHGTQSFGKLRTHYNGPGDHLKRVDKENQILKKNLTTRMKI